MKVARRIKNLVAEYGLADDCAASFATLLGLLEDDPTAPTTIVTPAEAVNAHLADSLTGLGLEEVRMARRIADLGAGAGFPGLPLAIALPEAQVSLVESVGRKVAFLESAIEGLGLSNAAPVCVRAEDWRDGLGTQDLVTARALAPLTALVEYAAPLLREGGVLVAWKGHRDEHEEADGAAAAAATGMELGRIEHSRPFPGADHHHLYLYVKVAETPDRYPRRAGMARKRPIAAST